MAKSRSIGGIYASLSLRDGAFKAGLKSSGKALKEFAATSAKYAAAGIATGTVAATAALTAGTIKTLDQVDALGDLAAQTGVAVADMMVMQRAYQDGGRAAENAGKDIGKMQKAIVEAAHGGTDPFASIGLSAEKLLAMNPAQQFETIGAAIMRIQNPAERTAKAMEIFGKGGMGLTTVFQGLEGAKNALGEMPALAQKFAGAMGQANDLIGHLPIKSQQFFTGFTAGIIGELLPGLEKIDSFDFTQIGQNLGHALAIGFEGLLDGTLFTIMSEKFYASIIGAFGGAQLSAELNADADLLWNELKSRIDENLNKASGLSTPGAIESPIISTYIPEAAKKAAAEPMEAMVQVNEYQRRGLSLGEIPDNSNKIDTQINIMQESRDLLKQIADSYMGSLTWGKA